MTNNDLNELILNPSMLPLVDTQELQEMAERYPYFQNIRFLSVKKHLIIQSPNYQKNLNIAATYAMDRKFLYDFLYEAEIKALPTGNLEGLEDENIDFEVVVDTENEHVIDENQATLPILDDAQSEDLIENVSDDTNYFEEEETPEEEVIGGQPEVSEDIDFRVNEILNKIGEVSTDHNLEGAISRIRNMQLGKKEIEKKKKLTEEQKVFQFHSDIEELVGGNLETKDLLGDYPKEIINNSETTFTFLKGEDSEEEEEDSAEIEELKAAMRKKHIERLRKSVEAFFKLDEVIESETAQEEILQDIPDDMSFKEWMKSLKKQYTTDDFPVSTGIKAKIEQSIEEDDELMSEALAELLVNQGNNVRAIRMYQHLILKFPEKKTFFAQKIKDLN
ncbi:MAG: hypothetical protein ACPG19_13250 [Saprospiraceae bacterium]